MFIPKFGNKDHIEAVKVQSKLETLKVELENCQACTKKINRLKSDIEMLERQFKTLIEE